MKNGFIARVFHYISGELHVIEHTFDRIEDAISHGIKAAAHSFKVYDTDGCIHHDSQHRKHHHGHDHYC